MVTFDKKTENICPHCGSIRSLSSFSVGIVEGQKFLPYCKNCINEKYKEYLEATGLHEAATWILCMELKIPVIRECFEIARDTWKNKTIGRKPTLFSIYYTTVKEFGIILHGVWESDLMLDEFISAKNKQYVEEVQEEKLSLDDLIRLWGKRENDEDYKFLEETYHRYTDDIEVLDTAQEFAYRDLCMAHLQKRRADENGDIAESEKAKKQINSALSLLKIDKFGKEEKSDMDRFIDRLIWKIEETEPCEEEDREKYRDIAGYEGHFKDIMRSLKNILTGDKNYPGIPKDEE